MVEAPDRCLSLRGADKPGGEASQGARNCEQETVGCSEHQGFRSSEKEKLVRVEGVAREISEDSVQR